MSLDNMEIARGAATQAYLHIAATTILFYDALITVHEELRLIWGTPKSLVAIGYLLNRYAAIAGNIAVTYTQLVSIAPESCRTYVRIRQYFILVTQGAIAFMLLLRMFALYRHNLKVPYLLLAILLIGLGGEILTLRMQTGTTVVKYLGCHDALSSEAANHLAVAWELLLCYDLLVFGLTVNATYSGIKERRYLRRHVSIKVLILRDGAIYFLALSGVNLANVVMYYVASPLLRDSLSTLTSNISVLMISRLTLSVRESTDAQPDNSIGADLPSLEGPIESMPPTRPEHETHAVE